MAKVRYLDGPSFLQYNQIIITHKNVLLNIIFLDHFHISASNQSLNHLIAAEKYHQNSQIILGFLILIVSYIGIQEKFVIYRDSRQIGDKNHESNDCPEVVGKIFQVSSG